MAAEGREVRTPTGKEAVAAAVAEGVADRDHQNLPPNWLDPVEQRDAAVDSEGGAGDVAGEAVGEQSQRRAGHVGVCVTSSSCRSGLVVWYQHPVSFVKRFPHATPSPRCTGRLDVETAFTRTAPRRRRSSQRPASRHCIVGPREPEPQRGAHSLRADLSCLWFLEAVACRCAGHVMPFASCRQQQLWLRCPHARWPLDRPPASTCRSAAPNSNECTRKRRPAPKQETSLAR